MRVSQSVLVEREKLIALQCDCCGKKFDDMLDIQEMLTWENIGGYSSIFGDGVQMSIDLCQDCLKKLLGPYIKYKEEE